MYHSYIAMTSETKAEQPVIQPANSAPDLQACTGCGNKLPTTMFTRNGRTYKRCVGCWERGNVYAQKQRAKREAAKLAAREAESKSTNVNEDETVADMEAGFMYWRCLSCSSSYKTRVDSTLRGPPWCPCVVGTMRLNRSEQPRRSRTEAK